MNSFPPAFITFLASFLIWFMIGAMVYLWLFHGRITNRQALHACLAAIGALTVSEVIKTLFPTTRPFMENGLPPLTITIPSDGAFPSAHAATSFGLATGLWVHDKKLGTGFIASAVLVGWGRMLSNVHYFADVFGGAFLGILVAFALDRLRTTST